MAGERGAGEDRADDQWPDDGSGGRGRPGWWRVAGPVAGLASIGAGAVHAAAAGVHAEHATLSRLFVLTAAAQLVVGIVLLVRSRPAAAAAALVVNVVAVGAWAVTRVWGTSWIAGLEQAEAPAFADTACAVLGAIAVLGAAAVLVSRAPAGPTAPAVLAIPAVAIGAVTVLAMMAGATHVHSHDEAAAGHTHGADEVAAETADPVHDASTHDHPGTEPAVVASAWPRPWDPSAPIDFSGVPGVTPEQQARTESLAAATLVDLPQFGDPTTLGALGFRSIGDASTGYEHYINPAYIVDDHFLDPKFPESLVFAADGEQRTLVSAMFIDKDRAVDDPELVDWGGPLMQWHVHEDLCWSRGDDGFPRVSGLTDADGNCPAGSVNAGGRNPMVHVWIAPHECGPFAALEGHGAGQTAGDTPRTDQCGHAAHEHPTTDQAPATTTASFRRSRSTWPASTA